MSFYLYLLDLLLQFHLIRMFLLWRTFVGGYLDSCLYHSRIHGGTTLAYRLIMNNILCYDLAALILFLIVILNQNVVIGVGILPREEPRLGLPLSSVIVDSFLWCWTLTLSEISCSLKHNVAHRRTRSLTDLTARRILLLLNLLICKSLLKLYLLLHLQLFVG